MNKGKILLFLGLAFGLSGLVGAAIHLLDIRPGSVVFTIVVGVLFMPTPALATLVVQKLIYKESLAPYRLRVKAIRLPALLWLPVLTAAIVLGTLGLNYLLGNAGGLPGFGQVISRRKGCS